MDESPTVFSGGMQQRLRLIANLISSPRLLFMDEPTTGLDVSVQARLLDLLKTLRSQLNLSMILVTHDLGVARMLADRILVMLNGSLVEAGLADQVLEDPQHAYTQQLVASSLL
jgi:putative phosphonate transport system ATP-binding protein